jgi:DNA ligase-1
MTNETFLKKLSLFVEKLNSSNSSTHKIEVLKQYKNDAEIKRILEYVYSPFKQFYITSSGLKKNHKLTYGAKPEWDNVFDLLDDLLSRKFTGHDAIGRINVFIKEHPSYKELIYNILDKDLKARISESSINKAIPGCVPTFDVALAKAYEPKDVDFEKEEWYASHKLDGVRCAAVIDEKGNIRCYSRQGKEFEVLGVLIDEIKKLNLKSVVLDGEVCIMNGEIEDFQATMKVIRKKDYTIPHPRFLVFDLLDLKDFYNKQGTMPLKNRLDRLSLILKGFNPKIITMLPQELIKNEAHFQEWVKMAADKNWEGFMIRQNVGYEGKRSKNLLKIKKFHDAEYTVTKMEPTEFRYIVDGKEITETMLGNIIIEHKGFEVGVGSGFSIDQRKEFYKHPNRILGKVVTVAYFEETKNQQGGLSLRFPTVKVVHGDKRTV